MRSLLLAVCLVLALHCGEAALSCDTVGPEFNPCVPYLTHGGDVVPDTCCNGLRTLSSQAQSDEDRHNACVCMKAAIQGIPPPDAIMNAERLAEKCGVTYLISDFTFC
ncbi:Non-specific lipid-transfer protein 6 [Cardamine amara subsp. amara]|uniref:Non-specific lipid-transfer protein n=1 Tax=Cardamine amara subsp. amara TaxID=228776 RepID=A0ABD1APR2_CARAN